MILGSRIKEWREKKGYSRRALSEESRRIDKKHGLSESGIQKIEEDRTPNPGIYSVKIIGDILGFKLDKITKGD